MDNYGTCHINIYMKYEEKVNINQNNVEILLARFYLLNLLKQNNYP